MMHTNTHARYWLIGLLFVISVIPQLLLMPIFGVINILFMIAIWVILCVFTLLGPKLAAACIAVVGAAAMAIPPVPNYLFPTNEGNIQFQFIGWHNLANSFGSVVFLFVFYFVVFELAAWLTRKKKQPTK